MKLFLLLFFLTFKAYPETQVFEAIAKHEGQMAYVERHTVVYDDQTLIKSFTEYLDPEGKLIASMRSDYTHNLAAPEFVLQDKRNQSLQGERWRKGNLEVFSRETKKDRMASRSLATSNQKEVLISGPGLIYFIAANLQKIISNDVLDFQYVIPGRLEAFDFYIETLAHNNQQVEFEIKMKSWLMRLFGPRLKLIYNIQKKRLISFEGLSNLRDEEGKMMSVDIQYKYKD